MKIKKIYTKIGPFYILIVIKDMQSLVSQEIFSRLITYLTGFIIKNSSLKPDFTIEIIESSSSKRDFLTIEQNKRIKVYLKNFVWVPHNKVITYNGISIYAFDFILRRIIAFLLYKNDFFFIHTSACLYRKKAYLFLGKNGAGKSTIIKLLHPISKPLVDDFGIIAKKQNNYYFYQTPLICKNPIKGSYKKYEIQRLFFIFQANSFSIKPLTLHEKKESIIKLFRNSVLNNIDNDSLLCFINKFQKNLYQLNFTLNRSELIKNKVKIFG